jgi:NAD-dependent SIR2 family protein deacetylase
MSAVENAGALLCVGTSLAVYSGFRFCRHAEASGVPIVALGMGKTRADPLLALKVEAPCGPALRHLASELGAAPLQG